MHSMLYWEMHSMTRLGLDLELPYNSNAYDTLIIYIIRKTRCRFR